jgi:hypothetical protein
MTWTTNHIDEPDDGRYLKYAFSRVQLASVVFQHFGFAPKHQHYGPARAA